MAHKSFSVAKLHHPAIVVSLVAVNLAETGIHKGKMMREQNLVKFDEVAEKVLSYLKMSFPVPANIGPESLKLQVSKKGEYNPESGGTTGGEPETEDEQFFGPVIEWLFLSGYIHAQKSSHLSGYFALVLTEKGLDIMGMKPFSLTKR